MLLCVEHVTQVEAVGCALVLWIEGAQAAIGEPKEPLVLAAPRLLRGQEIVNAILHYAAAATTKRTLKMRAPSTVSLQLLSLLPQILPRASCVSPHLWKSN